MATLPSLLVIFVSLSIGYSQRQLFLTNAPFYDYLTSHSPLETYALNRYSLFKSNNFQMPNAFFEERSKLLRPVIHPSDIDSSISNSFFRSGSNDDKVTGRFGLAKLNNAGKTIVHYVTSYITNVETVNCIPATLFEEAAFQTQACRRKRDEDLIDRAADAIDASPLVRVEKSVEQRLPNPEDMSLTFSPNKVRSSKESPNEQSYARVSAREKRFLYLLINQLVTVSTTSTKIETTTSKTTFTANLAAAAAVTCLPLGFVVCT